jgi:GNAT superfamily N-acetyltransferase
MLGKLFRMTESVWVSPIRSRDVEAWADGFRRRFAAPRVGARLWAPDAAAANASRFVAKLLPKGSATPGHHVLDIVTGSGPIGHLLIRIDGPDAFLFDIEVSEQAIDAGLATEIMNVIEAYAAGRGADLLRLNVFRSEVATHRIVDGSGFTVSTSQMRRWPAGGGPIGCPDRPRVELRPMSAEEFAEFLPIQESSYAHDLVRSRKATSIEEACQQSAEENAESFPDGVDSEDQTLLTAFAGERRVGTLWLDLSVGFEGPKAFIDDLYVRPELRRCGYGRGIMLAAERYCVERGAVEMGLSVFGFNEAARALYEQVGYAITEQMLWKDISAAR